MQVNLVQPVHQTFDAMSSTGASPSYGFIQKFNRPFNAVYNGARYHYCDAELTTPCDVFTTSPGWDWDTNTNSDIAYLLDETVP